jgi:VWFA-related protein
MSHNYPRHAILAACGLALGLSLAAFAQQPSAPTGDASPPTVIFRTDANFVEVNAIVTDGRGEIVEGLSREDFEVYEDGQLQAPTVFAFVDLPAAPASTPVLDAEADVRSTGRGFDGRLYVVVLDDLHTTVLRTNSVRDAARRFITDQMAPGDFAAVVHTSGRIDAAQELTSNKRLLLAAVDKFFARKLPSAASERLAAHLNSTLMGANELTQQSELTRNPIADPLDQERGANARRALEVVKNVAGLMADIQGRRKALVLFSEGIDYDIYDMFNSPSAGAVMQEARDAISTAQRAGVSIYTVDSRGLSAGGDTLASEAAQADPSIREISPGAFGRELLLSQESLIGMAEETGGFAAVRTNNIAGALARIARENSKYYLLGYNSDASRAPGRFRKIEVRVKRPGLRVRARRGYVPIDPRRAKAPERPVASGASNALKAAMASPLPVGDLPLRLFAAPFKGSGRNGSVLVALEIDGTRLGLEERNGVFNGKLEVSIAAVDYQGRVRDSTLQGFDLRLDAGLREAITNEGGIRVLSRLDLPPARYQLRVGAHDAVAGRTGTLSYDLEIPDYSEAIFSLSGLVLAAAQPDSIATLKPDPLLKDALPGPPVAARVFHPQDTITLLTELYDRSAKSGHSIEFVTTVRRAGPGEVAFESRQTRSVEGGTLRESYKVDVPAKGLAPGAYLLTVEATSRAGNQSASRTVPFEVSLTPGGIASR